METRRIFGMRATIDSQALPPVVLFKARGRMGNLMDEPKKLTADQLWSEFVLICVSLLPMKTLLIVASF